MACLDSGDLNFGLNEQQFLFQTRLMGGFSYGYKYKSQFDFNFFSYPVAADFRNGFLSSGCCASTHNGGGRRWVDPPIYEGRVDAISDWCACRHMRQSNNGFGS